MCSLTGESIYKDKIRRLNLLHSNYYGNEGSQEVRSYSVPCLSLDLEHFNMPHWLPGNDHQMMTQGRLVEEEMSQVRMSGILLKYFGVTVDQ